MKAPLAHNPRQPYLRGPLLAELSWDGVLFLGIGSGELRPTTVGVLKLIKFPVEAALDQQLLVRTLFANLAVMKDDDLVGALDGREAMGHDD